MKKLIVLAGIAVAFVGARAEGFKANLVPAGARWMLHLDAEAFRKTRIGAAVVDEKLEPQVRKVEGDAKLDLDFSFQKITALTAFGGKIGDQNDGVLLVQTTADVRGDLEKLMGLKEKNGGSEPAISRITVNGADLYTIGGDLNAMPAAANMWLLGKSKTTLQAARNVVLGKAASLQKTNFLNYPTVSDNYFFLAVFDIAGAGDALPAQAKILQNADGGRIALGEKGEKLFLNLALRSKNTETVSQIRLLLQGLAAFVSLTQKDNPDLVAIANSAAVSSEDDLVSVSLSFPLKRAMEKVREDK